MNSAMNDAYMIAADLIDDGPFGPRIIAWRRPDGRIVFPKPSGQGTAHEDCEPVLLSRCGMLWSWTVQRFRPKSPPFVGPDADAFQPYSVGYVEFPEGIIIEGRIDVDVDSVALEIGMKMETTVIPLFAGGDGRTVQIYAFKPVSAQRNPTGG